MRFSWRAAASLALALLLGRALPGSAQQPDSLAADSAAVADSLLDETERLLASEGRARERVPAIPYLDAEGPRPAGTRWVFTRDSLDWSSQETLGELLTRVPGLALVRGGWVGRAEAPNYLGRGPGGVVVFLDGIPFEPLGPDSTQVDPGLIGLNSLDRVEVLRTPGRLEVHLSTIRHGLSAPLSRIGIASGDRDFARYEGLLTQRAASGLGYGLAAEVLDVPNPGGVQAGFQHTQAWAQLSWLPSARSGIVAQVVTQDLQREPFIPEGGTEPIDLGVDGTRSQLSLRAFTTWGSESAPTRLDLLLSRSAWSGNDIEQSHLRGGLQVSHRRPGWHLGGRAAVQGGWTTFEAGATAGALAGPITAAAEGVLQRHRADRTSSWLGGSAGLALPAGLGLRVEGRLGSAVQVPAIDSLEAASVTSVAAFATWSRPWLDLEAGVQHVDGPPPLPLGPFGLIRQVGDSGATTWLTGQVRLRPANWLTLWAVGSAPASAEPEGGPPVHGQAAATIRSRFLRTFPSGFLDLKLELGAEFWGEGTVGRTPDGTPILLPSELLVRAGLEIQLGRFHAYFRRFNLLNREVEWLPELRYPTFATTFGVRWDFLN